MVSSLADGAPAGSLVISNESGWMTKETFLEWLKHFQKFAKASREDKVLLVLDGHNSHTRNIEALEFAKQNGIVMVSLPARTTHKLQPLDRTFYKPLMTYYNKACGNFLRRLPGVKITIFNLCRLFSEAYDRCSTVSIAKEGFACTGLWPVNRNIFHDDEFVSDSNRTLGDDSDIACCDPALVPQITMHGDAPTVSDGCDPCTSSGGDPSTTTVYICDPATVSTGDPATVSAGDRYTSSTGDPTVSTGDRYTSSTGDPATVSTVLRFYFPI
jgi:hypothetical protein